MTIEPDILAQAVEHHRAGRLGEAAERYRRLLALRPHDADALHLLGVAARQSGAPGQAMALIGRALAVAPALANARHNLANAAADARRAADALLSMKRPADAAALLDAVLAAYPEDGEARTRRAAIGAVAEAFYRPVLSCQIPDLGDLMEAAFGARRDGTFVEVGAYDGESFSNTAHLADLGWRGLYIEPVPAYAAMCAARHRANAAVRVVSCAIGAEEGSVDLFLGGTLSTTVPAQVNTYARMAWAQGLHTGERIRVPRRRLDAVLEENGVPPGFDLLVIDVEGAEAEVIAGLDLDHWRPAMLIIELEDRHPDFQDHPDVVARCAALRRRIAAHGYAEAYGDTINTVFLRRAATP